MNPNADMGRWSFDYVLKVVALPGLPELAAASLRVVGAVGGGAGGGTAGIVGYFRGLALPADLDLMALLLILVGLV